MRRARVLMLCVLLIGLAATFCLKGLGSCSTAWPYSVMAETSSNLQSHSQLKRLSALLDFNLTVAGEWEFRISLDEKKYVCPPCGCSHDGKVFDHAGTCPSCEMQLVEKAPDAASSAASFPEAEAINVKSQWVLEPPPSQANTAAYMIIENNASTDITLTSAISDVAAALELHTMETDSGGMMRMRKLDVMRVPAKGRIELKPGDLHLMLIGLRREIQEGDEVSIRLLFADSTKKTISLPVKKRQ